MTLENCKIDWMAPFWENVIYYFLVLPFMERSLPKFPWNEKSYWNFPVWGFIWKC